MIIFLELRPCWASSTYSHSQPLTLPTPAASTALVHLSASQLTNTENVQNINLSIISEGLKLREILEQKLRVSWESAMKMSTENVKNIHLSKYLKL